jgi:hypothetical protein
MAVSSFRNIFELFQQAKVGELVVKEEMASYGVAKRELQG